MSDDFHTIVQTSIETELQHQTATGQLHILTTDPRTMTGSIEIQTGQLANAVISAITNYIWTDQFMGDDA